MRTGWQRKSSRWRRTWWWVGTAAVGLGVVLFAAHELRHATLQASSFARSASEARFSVAPGPSPSIRFPRTGPYDRRLGYAALGERFFGVVTAYVPGPRAARYEFTSALPVQVLKALAPALWPFVADAAHTRPGQCVPGELLRAVREGRDLSALFSPPTF